MKNYGRKREKKKVILLIVGIVTVLLVTIGATYAFFTAQLGTGGNVQVGATTGTTDHLTFTTTAGINITADDTTFAKDAGDRSGETSATAILTANDATNSADATYYLYLDIAENGLTYTTEDRKPELIMEITDPEDNSYTGEIAGLTCKEDITNGKGEILKGYDIAEAKGLIPLVKEYAIHAEAESPTAREEQTWKVKITLINLDTDQNPNTGKTLSGKLVISKEEIKEEGIQDKLLADANKEETTLYLHNNELEGGAQDDSYRYSGSSEKVKNYVCLDGGATSEGKCGEDDSDLYRIIGLFKNSNDEYEMKLIKCDYATSTQLGDTGAYNTAYVEETESYKGNQDNLSNIGGYYWTSSSNLVNEWAGSDLRNVNLNDYYLNTYLKGQKNIDVDNLITTHTWSLNGHDDDDVTPKEMYDNEMAKLESSPSVPTVTKEVQDKIGLMYTSDYGYATSPSNTSNWSKNLYDYNSYTSYNWMYRGLYEWTISRNSAYSDYAFYVNNDGAMYRNGYVFDEADAVRSSFYLTSNTQIQSGDGSKDSPYRISVA